MTSADVIEIYTTLAGLRICVWIDGGWGVDALLGRQTRSHKDLDIVIEDHQLLQFEQFLTSLGYHRIKREIERPFNFVLADHRGREIDVHVISRDENGNGIYGPPDMGMMYPAQSLTGHGVIDDFGRFAVSPPNG
jgi:lincosamide nucleotidyltransferase A/C/D/E